MRVMIGAVLCGLLLAAAGPTIYKWVDEQGTVHYSDTPPEDREAEELAIEMEASRQHANDNGVFKLVTSTDQLYGCWKRVTFPKEVMERMNKIQLYPSAFEKHQWFCFLDNNELYTKFKDRPEEQTLSELIKDITVYPSVERYSLERTGVVLIHHLDADQKTYWLTSEAEVRSPVAAESNIQDGDLLMTIRNFETGEDLYYRHLRRVK